MKTLLRSFFNSLLHDMGNPASIKHLLLTHPDIIVPFKEVKSVLEYGSLVRWDRLAHLGTSYAVASGRQRTPTGMVGTNVFLQALTTLAAEETIKHWSCDIRQVQGLSASKSDLDLDNMDAFALAHAADLIGQATEADLERNLDHKGITVTSPCKDGDYFDLHLWDPRLYLMNTDGSHHFAAASYIAGQLNKKVPVYGKLKLHSIHMPSLRHLCDQYDLVAISDQPQHMNAFYDAMDDFKATFYWLYMPKQYAESRIILLPKNEQRSMQVATLLKEAGAFDVGDYLFKLGLQQVHLHDCRVT